MEILNSWIITFHERLWGWRNSPGRLLAFTPVGESIRKLLREKSWILTRQTASMAPWRQAASPELLEDLVVKNGRDPQGAEVVGDRVVISVEW